MSSSPSALPSTNQPQHNQETTGATVRATGAANRTLLPVVSQSLSSDCVEEEEEKFLRKFENQVFDLVREINRQFPYKQSIIWSIEYDENKEYSIHVMANGRH
jgi:hypothetical protein